MSDLISRQAAIDALWKALYEYEDKTEKRFQESEELDVADWFQHRIFVQNMSDIDRRTLRDLPTIDAVPVVRCKDCRHHRTNNTAGFPHCEILNRFVTEDWFCAFGERKDDGMDC